jgi:hypothetical protein
MAGQLKDIRSALLYESEKDWHQAKVTGMFDPDDMVQHLEKNDQGIVVLDHIGEGRQAQTAWCRALITRDEGGGYGYELAFSEEKQGGLDAEGAIATAIEAMRAAWENTPPTERNDPHVEKVSGYQRRSVTSGEREPSPIAGVSRILREEEASAIEEALEEVAEEDPTLIPRDPERPEVSNHTVTPKKFQRQAPSEGGTSSSKRKPNLKPGDNK